ncbi:MAG: DEAD/DEAH box helicase [Candidatus Nanoarchaeia archaeon]|nr:DEAD/DEAH box helicase [Candidatus Nanoarchaeia archaeon]
MKQFIELGLNKEMLDHINKLGFEEPTDVQEKTIPLVLEGKDVIVGSATGSGKTIAFGAPILQNCHSKGGIQALILTPTRELAEQIQGVLRTISRLKVNAIYGGVSINQQFKELERAEIVVGTPGRLLDHLERNTIDLTNVKYLVLDEADRMLDMGFLDDVNKIIGRCPKQKQMLLFSATIPPEVAQISKKFMNSPTKITISNLVDPKKMNQVYYDIQSKLKFSLLVHLLQKEKTGLVMVFCNSRRYVDVVARNLNSLKIDALGIHGGLSQAQRTRVLQKFKSPTPFVLVCTDVAARGLDIPSVSHVYNYDLPQDPKQYIHRIGRTARAGKSGEIINLLSQKDYEYFSNVLREYNVQIKKQEKPFIEELKIPEEKKFGNRPAHSQDRRGPPRDGRRPRPRGESGDKPFVKKRFNRSNEFK